jgi:hypothetical protein
MGSFNSLSSLFSTKMPGLSSLLKIADAIKSGIAYRCSNSDRVIIGDWTMFGYDLSFNFMVEAYN